MSHTDNIPNFADLEEFPGSYDSYTPAQKLFKEYAVQQRSTLNRALEVLEERHNADLAALDTFTDNVTAAIDAERTKVESSFNASLNDVSSVHHLARQNQLALDQYNTASMPYNSDKPLYVSPFTSPYVSPEGVLSQYLHMLPDPTGWEIYKSTLEFMDTDDDVPEAYKSARCHGIVLRYPQGDYHTNVWSIMPGEVIAAETNHEFFGRVVVVRGVDGRMIRYHQLSPGVRYSAIGETLPAIKVGTELHAGDSVGVAVGSAYIDVSKFGDISMFLDPYTWEGASHDNISAHFEDFESLYVDSGYEDVVHNVVTGDMPAAITEGIDYVVSAKLSRPPVGRPTRVEVSCTDDAVYIGPPGRTFDRDDWDIPQKFFLRIPQNATYFADRSADIVVEASGGGYDVANTHAVTLSDDEPAPADATEVDPAFSIRFFEDTLPSDMSSMSFLVSLNKQPSEDVTVTANVTPADKGFMDETNGLAGPLVFTRSNWFVEQWLSVATAVDADSVDDVLTLTLQASGGDFQGVAFIHAITILDETTIAVQPALEFSNLPDQFLHDVSEQIFGVKLNKQPSGDVTVAPSLSFAPGVEDDKAIWTEPNGDAAVAKVFTQDNWNTFQTWKISTEEDDDLVDDVFTMHFDVTGGGFGNASQTHNVTILDNVGE